MPERTYKQWLVLDWKTGQSRTRKSKPSSSDLKANEILAELKVDVQIPEVDVPTLAVEIEVPEPQVYQATLDAIDDEDLPDWSDAASQVITDHRDTILAAEDTRALDAVVDQMTTRVLMDAPGRPPVDQVHDYLEKQAGQLYRDHQDDEQHADEQQDLATDGGREFPSIPFADEHVDAVQTGEKTVTVRLDLEHDLDPLQLVELVDGDGIPFNLARVTTQCKLRADWITSAEIAGHQSYSTTGDLLDDLAEYYPDADLGPDTDLDVVAFQVVNRIRTDGGAVDIGDLHASSVLEQDGTAVLAIKGTDGAVRVRVPERMVEPFQDTVREAGYVYDGVPEDERALIGDGSGQCGKRDCDRTATQSVDDSAGGRKARCDRHALEELEGIGPRRAETLHEEFGSIDALQSAITCHTVRIARLPGFSPDSPDRLEAALKSAGLWTKPDAATDGGEDAPHWCDICSRPFWSIAELINHTCQPREDEPTEPDDELVTDGGVSLESPTSETQRVGRLSDLDGFSCVTNENQTLLVVEQGGVSALVAIHETATEAAVDTVLETAWDYSEDVLDPTVVIASLVGEQGGQR